MAVAEQAVYLTLALLRNGVSCDRSVREGRQIQMKSYYLSSAAIRELSDLTVGLIGFGDSGKAAAGIFHAFGAEVVYTQRHRADRAVEEKYGARYLPLDELLKVSNIISFHCPVTPETEYMANDAFFANMQNGSHLVNVARGELVDDAALLRAMESGQVAMAGIDTLDHEPVQANHPILNAPSEILERFVFSPHIAGVTGTSMRKCYAMIWEDIADLLQGLHPKRVVNGL